jgi:hypothetical protein
LHPTYLFKGARPVIESAPAEISYGTPFEVAVDEASDVARVALLKPGSVTHGVDFSQRYVDVDFQTAGASTLELVAPPDGGVAPPGYYMLFVVDSDGVPSRARWVRVS